MPSLFKFLFVTGTFVAVVYAGMYVLATRFEPEPRDTVYRLQNLKASGPLASPEAADDAEAAQSASEAE